MRRLAHIDSEWVYPGDGDYQGLLKEVDLSAEALGRKGEVKDWIAAAQAVARKRKEPECEVDGHCTDPYPCGFLDYCQRDAVAAEYPVAWLPNRSKKLQRDSTINSAEKSGRLVRAPRSGA